MSTPLARDDADIADTADQATYPSGLYPWYVVGVLLVVWALSNIDRQAINILVMPIQQDVGLSETQMGLLLGPAYVLFYVAAGLPLGRVVDFHNRRNLLVGGLIVWSAGTFAAGFARSFEALFAARGVIGLGEACLIPASLSLIADYFPPSRRGRAMAVVTVGLSAGAGLSLLGGGTVLEWMQHLEGRTLPVIGAKMAWELVFIVFGLAGIVAAFLLLTIREPLRRSSGKRKEAAPSSFIAFLRSHRWSMLLILAPYLLVSYIIHAFATWAPTLLVRHLGMSVGDAAQLKGFIILIVSTLSALAGGIVGDYLSRRYRGGRFLLLIVLGSLMLPALAIACLGTQLWIVASGIALYLMTGGLLASTAYVAVQDVVPPEVRGRTIALYTISAQIIGSAVGPAVVALVTEHVLGDPSLLHYSILVAVTPVWLVFLLCAVFGIAHFRAMRARYG